MAAVDLRLVLHPSARVLIALKVGKGLEDTCDQMSQEVSKRSASGL